MRLKRFKQKYNKVLTECSSNQKVEDLLRDQSGNSQEVKENLLFSEVIKKQLTINYRGLKKKEDKKKFWTFISGKVVRKYTKTTYLHNITSCFVKTNKQDAKKRRAGVIKLKDAIRNFLEMDECSRLCPEKKDFIQKFKIKKQKRLLNDSLKNLHKKFVNGKSVYISYRTFCRLKPFWVHAKVSERDTCLCQQHTNMMLLVRKLNAVGVIKERTPEALLKSLCCDQAELQEKCLERSCEMCKNRQSKTNEFSSTDTATFEKWTTKKVLVTIRGVENSCLKTIKDKFTSIKGEMLNILQKSLEPFFVHVKNIYHQYKAIKQIKASLSTNEVLLHIDFSENFSCKYAEEVQSAHFGGSKPQLSLYTVVAYYKTKDGQLEKTCYCTVSDNLRHDPIALCAHLDPVFKHIMSKMDLKYIHFLSDGPCNQYRYRKMFHLIANYLSSNFSLKKINWHYSEKGHGKGALDGVGGVLKRTADGLVSKGIDIPNLDSFVYYLQKACKNVNVFKLPLETKSLDLIEKYIPETLPKYKGIMMCHEVVWTQNSPFLDVRKLSCLSCLLAAPCIHYSIGPYYFAPRLSQQIKEKPKLIYEELCSSSEEDVPLAELCAQMREKHKVRYEEVYSSSDEEIPVVKPVEKKYKR